MKEKSAWAINMYQIPNAWLMNGSSRLGLEEGGWWGLYPIIYWLMGLIYLIIYQILPFLGGKYFQKKNPKYDFHSKYFKIFNFWDIWCFFWFLQFLVFNLKFFDFLFPISISWVSILVLGKISHTTHFILIFLVVLIFFSNYMYISTKVTAITCHSPA